MGGHVVTDVTRHIRRRVSLKLRQTYTEEGGKLNFDGRLLARLIQKELDLDKGFFASEPIDPLDVARRAAKREVFDSLLKLLRQDLGATHNLKETEHDDVRYFRTG